MLMINREMYDNNDGDDVHPRWHNWRLVIADRQSPGRRMDCITVRGAVLILSAYLTGEGSSCSFQMCNVPFVTFNLYSSKSGLFSLKWNSICRCPGFDSLNLSGSYHVLKL
jgi:hypothetical protein